MKQVQQRKTKTIAPMPIFAPWPRFIFPNSEGLRNPFKAISTQKQNASSTPEPLRVKHILETYPLDALRFVGTLTQGRRIWGLIKLPDDQIVQVHAGDYMGQNYGQIMDIKINRLRLSETVKSVSGQWEQRKTILDLDSGT